LGKNYTLAKENKKIVKELKLWFCFGRNQQQLKSKLELGKLNIWAKNQSLNTLRYIQFQLSLNK
jgi:hypothetical protein